MAHGRARDEQKERQWRHWIAQWRASWLSVRAFCARHGLATPSFYHWRQVLERRAADPVVFAPVQVVADVLPCAAGRIEIVLPGARRVHIVGHVERQMLVDVLAVLAEVSGAPPADAGASAVSRC